MQKYDETSTWVPYACSGFVKYSIVDFQLIFVVAVVRHGIKGSAHLVAVAVDDCGYKRGFGGRLSFCILKAFDKGINVAPWCFGHVEVFGVRIIWLFVLALSKCTWRSVAQQSLVQGNAGAYPVEAFGFFQDHG